MKVKELLANLANVDPELEVYTGVDDVWFVALTEKDVNIQEHYGVNILTLRGHGESLKLTTFCERCSSLLDDDEICTDATCPFSSHYQNCDVGWTGHPDHPGEFWCSCREDD